MNFNLINNASSLADYPPTKKMAELEIDQKYNVTGIKSLSSKFGTGVIATIDNKFGVFLPSRIAKFLGANADQLELMSNAAKEKLLQMKYHGGRFNKCEFFSEKVWTFIFLFSATHS